MVVKKFIANLIKTVIINNKNILNMKRINVILTTVLFCFFLGANAQMAVSTDGSSADPSAMLDVKSANKGMLVPRMAQADIESIADPANGLLVYNTDDNRFYFYDGTAAEWKEVALGAGTITPGGTPPAAGEVTNPTTGKTWMDKNLGAEQVATAYNDPLSYGDLYQWGRATEGHEKRTSTALESGQATTAAPNLGNAWDGIFLITSSGIVSDWLATTDNTLWQGVSGPNNPCPSGFRLPTQVELQAEVDTWETQNPAGAFGSVLKLPSAGSRSGNNGGITYAGTYPQLWTSTVSNPYSIFFGVYSTSVYVGTAAREGGYSVRCIKD
jgi:uncharacterized protein (TIGR02145 family)